MNSLQRSATQLGRLARREAEIWKSIHARIPIILAAATGLASVAIWEAIR